ncbi:PDZ and LIM domain protein 5-like [Ruditapes philippinarum]|uniref:PDZ and LIM domain protein 5-like n=1 Tax=Ruditapes philippinarum TaxID=129788 RepID=UPI00295BAEF2|nr:PDZ and LIM domain protein 5-like [Ruditapes philippinarum]
MSRQVDLRRFDTSQPWGFKMQGGSDVGMPLFVAHVSPNSIAGQSGLKAGDAILQIGGTDTMGFTHEQARGEMLRCGNDVNLTVQSGLINPPAGSVVEEDRPRMSVSDSDSPYQDVTSKTFQMLENELPNAEQSGARPASIFDKKRQNRTAYTKTDKFWLH